MDNIRISRELYDGLAAILNDEANEEPSIHHLISAYGTTDRFVKLDNPVLSESEFEAIANPIRRLLSDY